MGSVTADWGFKAQVLLIAQLQRTGLFTLVRGLGILRSSPVANSRKFDAWRAKKEGRGSY